MPPTLRYGSGLLVPFRFDGVSDFAQGEEEELVRSDLKNMFGIETGELPYDMRLGSDFETILDDPIDDDGFIDAQLKMEALRALSADKRMIPSTNQTIRSPEVGTIDQHVTVDIVAVPGSSPLLRDVAESVRLR